MNLKSVAKVRLISADSKEFRRFFIELLRRCEGSATKWNNRTKSCRKQKKFGGYTRRNGIDNLYQIFSMMDSKLHPQMAMKKSSWCSSLSDAKSN